MKSPSERYRSSFLSHFLGALIPGKKAWDYCIKGNLPPLANDRTPYKPTWGNKSYDTIANEDSTTIGAAEFIRAMGIATLGYLCFLGGPGILENPTIFCGVLGAELVLSLSIASAAREFDWCARHHLDLER